LLKKAHGLSEMTQHEEAKKTYLQASKSEVVGVSELARLQAGLMLLKQNKPYTELEGLLLPLAEDAKNPFSAFAKEQLGLAAYAVKDHEKALFWFEQLLKADFVPTQMAERAKSWLVLLKASRK
jgi:hypothetical protein